MLHPQRDEAIDSAGCKDLIWDIHSCCVRRKRSHHLAGSDDKGNPSAVKCASLKLGGCTSLPSANASERERERERGSDLGRQSFWGLGKGCSGCCDCSAWQLAAAESRAGLTDHPPPAAFRLILQPASLPGPALDKSF